MVKVASLMVGEVFIFANDPVGILHMLCEGGQVVQLTGGNRGFFVQADNDADVYIAVKSPQRP